MTRRAAARQSDIARAIAAAERAGKRRRSWGFVYVVANPRGHCKVGVTINPADRFSGLKHATTEDLTIYFKVRTANAYGVEREAHRLLWPLRVRGEWFKCPPLVAKTAVQVATGAERPRAFLPMLLDFAQAEGRDAWPIYDDIYDADREIAVELDPFYAGIRQAAERKRVLVPRAQGRRP